MTRRCSFSVSIHSRLVSQSILLPPERTFHLFISYELMQESMHSSCDCEVEEPRKQKQDASCEAVHVVTDEIPSSIYQTSLPLLRPDYFFGGYIEPPNDYLSSDPSLLNG